jgi:hypothetical protein
MGPPEESQVAATSDEEVAVVVPSEPAHKVPRSEIDAEVLDAAVAAVVPELNRCYREALLRDKSIRGDITIEMTVAPQAGTELGILEDAVVDAEDLQAPILEQCLLSAMVKVRLPKPSSRLYISYPFTLDPGDDDEETAADQVPSSAGHRTAARRHDGAPEIGR